MPFSWLLCDMLVPDDSGVRQINSVVCRSECSLTLAVPSYHKTNAGLNRQINFWALVLLEKRFLTDFLKVSQKKVDYSNLVYAHKPIFFCDFVAVPNFFLGPFLSIFPPAYSRYILLVIFFLAAQKVWC